jgi:2-oxoglutarate dehydrogenase E1 component
VLCSGKIYYDLLEEREKRGIADVQLLRFEQLSPFPSVELAAELVQYKEASLVWCQEEPRNMGAWSYVEKRIEAVAKQAGLAGAQLRYAGRAASASPATGLHDRHVEEQKKLVNEALWQ